MIVYITINKDTHAEVTVNQHCIPSTIASVTKVGS